MTEEAAILEELTHNLVVLPKAPLELKLLNPLVITVLGHGRTVQLLLELKLRGLVICKQVQFQVDPETKISPPISSQIPGRVSIVSWEEVNSLDDQTIISLNLHYWSVLSRNPDTVSKCIDMLTERKLLSHELNKGYPNESIIVISVAEFHIVKVNTIRALLDSIHSVNFSLSPEYKLEKYFEYSLDKKQTDLFRILFSDPSKCDVFFMEYLGFEHGENEERRVEKYSKWGGNILFNSLVVSTYYENWKVEAVQLGIKVLMSYNILNYELSRLKECQTVLQWTMTNDYDKGEEQVLGPMKLILEAGFPNNLLLNECSNENGASENILDTAISRNDKWRVVDYLLSDEERRQIFLSYNRRDKYLAYIQQTLQ